MEFPIRCFSCGKVLAHLWKHYKDKINAGEKPEQVFDDLGIKRYCCRRMFLGHVELIDDILPYIRE